MKGIFRNSIKRIKIFSLRTIVKTADALNKTKKFNSDVPEKCLIISTTGIGDTIWCTPAIRALKESFPRIKIYALARSGGTEIFRDNPFTEDTFVFNKGLSNLLLLLKELRNFRFDTIIVFDSSDRIIWLMAHLTGAAKIIGSTPHSKEMGFVITNPVNIPSGTHSVYAKNLLIRELGVTSDSKRLDFFIADGTRKRAHNLLKEIGINQNSIVIGFQPGAAKPYKRWPERNFIELGKLITGCIEGVRIITFGDGKEAKLSQSIAHEVGGVSLAGMSIIETAPVIERCNLFITNDTGPLFIAIALNVPTIALFSATGDYILEPYRSFSTFTAISKPKPCHECISKACTDPVCMEQISPEEVFKVVEGQVAKLNSKFQATLTK